MSGHSDLPWTLEAAHGQQGERFIVTDPSGRTVAWTGHFVNGPIKRDEADGNFHFIVRCVNSHDALIDVVRSLLAEVREHSADYHHVTPQDVIDGANLALAKAEQP